MTSKTLELTILAVIVVLVAILTIQTLSPLVTGQLEKAGKVEKSKVTLAWKR